MFPPDLRFEKEDCRDKLFVFELDGQGKMLDDLTEEALKLAERVHCNASLGQGAIYAASCTAKSSH